MSTLGHGVASWPKGPIHWRDGSTVCVSIPFTWNLPEVRRFLSRTRLVWTRAVVGGPAVDLMPDYFAGMEGVSIGHDSPGILQRVNPMATRTTTGCIRRCKFCGIGQGRIEPGGLRELPDWPDLPILADNNLLAASPEHFDRVMDRLEASWGWADFTQGLDSRLLTQHHAERLARLRDPRTLIRLALDSMVYVDSWEDAFRRLRAASVALKYIRSYALIGFLDGPVEAWERCQWIEDHGIKVLPMWFHPLNALRKNWVTSDQHDLGWSNRERKNIMQWFYQHKAKYGGPPARVAA